MEGFVLIFVVVIALVVVIRIIHGGMDHERIQLYVEAHGNKLLAINWVPFGPGWLGKHQDRIYEIRYLDRDGIRHHAYCKTSGWSGVYFNEDNIEQSADLPDTERSLVEENRRLREELEQLKSRQS